MSQQPTVGKIVHFVPHATVGAGPCQAALVTAAGLPDESISLAVFRPLGGGSFDMADVPHQAVSVGDVRVPGTWHWPEAADVEDEADVDMSQRVDVDQARPFVVGGQDATEDLYARRARLAHDTFARAYDCPPSTSWDNLRDDERARRAWLAVAEELTKDCF